MSTVQDKRLDLMEAVATIDRMKMSGAPLEEIKSFINDNHQKFYGIAKLMIAHVTMEAIEPHNGVFGQNVADMSDTQLSKEIEEQFWSYIELCHMYEKRPSMVGFAEHIKESYGDE